MKNFRQDSRRPTAIFVNYITIEIAQQFKRLCIRLDVIFTRAARETALGSPPSKQSLGTADLKRHRYTSMFVVTQNRDTPSTCQIESRCG